MKQKAKPDRPTNIPLTKILDRNIRTLIEVRRASQKDRTFHQRLVGKTVAIISSTGFFYFHGILLCAWIILDHGTILSFERLTGIASLEAIFLSVLVLINQQNMSDLVENREDLDLQMSLITEHEITRILHVVDLMAKQMKIDTKTKVPDLEEAKKDISPEMVLERIEDLKDENIVSVPPQNA